MNLNTIFGFRLPRFASSVAAVLLTTVGLATLGSHINLITVSLTFLLIVLASATFFGRNPALLASFVAMLCFNYFFIPPVHTWRIADPQNLVSWAAFTLTALVAGELSAYAGRRARESERLYKELQDAFKSATEAEALKQSEKLKSALLDAVTHDLRTPLTSIKASVTTLLDSEGGHRTIELNSEGRAEFLDIINEETDRLNGFIESMVQLARVEAGSATADSTFSSVDVIVAIAAGRAENVVANHRVRLDLQKELPIIRVDARAVAEVTITIGSAAHGDSVLISVADQGRGIPVEMRRRVFDRFFRLDGEHSDGLGLGLAIARGRVCGGKCDGDYEIGSYETQQDGNKQLALPLGEQRFQHRDRALTMRALGGNAIYRIGSAPNSVKATRNNVAIGERTPSVANAIPG